MYLGSWDIDDYVPIPATCHRFSTGAAYAPTVLTYSIYEDGGTTGIDENVDMTPASPFDSIVGCYWARRQLTTAAGFEAGKNYIVVVKATVDSVAAIQTHVFQVKAKVDTRAIGGTTQTARDLGALLVNLALTTAAIATDGSNSATAFKTTLTEAIDEYWKDCLILITSGALIGQCHKIGAYNGTTKFVTLAGTETFTATPADAVTFVILNQ